MSKADMAIEILSLKIFEAHAAHAAHLLGGYVASCPLCSPLRCICRYLKRAISDRFISYFNT